MKIKASGLSDVGLKRDGNEDFFSVDSYPGLYIVADGMGGHLAGEVASRVAVEMIQKTFRKWTEENLPLDRIFDRPDLSLSLKGNYISGSIKFADRVIYEMACDRQDYHGMGTTVAVLLVTPGLVVTANVGDSRIYMLREGRLERLSKDHTLVREQVEMGAMSSEEAETSPLRHVLTRNLGSSKTVEPEVFEIEPLSNDRFMLCTDGLTDLVSDEEIRKILREADQPDTMCRKLVEKALLRGGHDNTTVVAVFFSGARGPKAPFSGKTEKLPGGLEG